MKNLFTIITIIIPLLGFAQNPPNCDSLTIDCCVVFDENTDLLELSASNSEFSTELYSYPGFILLNENGDTIAMETVNYFGIGNGPQLHYLNIMNLFELPFTGTLELYSGFYDSLHCVFPIAIEGTTAVVENEFFNEEFIQVYPNPFVELVYIDLKQLPQQNCYYIKVFNEEGKFVFNQKIVDIQSPIPISTLGKGNVYFVQVLDENEKIITTKKLIKY
ncbi:MAG: hypothetical protein ACI94Y_001840 [Maribacter sp.]|jgi:hypothetical protein